MPHDLPSIEILGVRIAKASRSEALRAVAELGEHDAPALIAYANAHTLNLAAADPAYRGLLEEAALVLNDGSGVQLAARIKGDLFPVNLNGSDLNPAILSVAAGRGWSAYFLGARPGTAARAAARLMDRIGGLEVVGTRDGFFDRAQDPEVAAEIKASGADILMVAMGNPLQERWLAANLAATGARVGVGVGAFFDFEAGEVARAPAVMNKLGIEWVWRLAQEPARLWRRYVVGNPLFLLRVLRSRLRKR
jgi:exopolysaccharide biosynthesis WecB/TagA/CpsF family protein